MKCPLPNKIFPHFGVVIITVLAIFHVLLTIKNYGCTLTAVPLWMKVAAVVMFWTLIMLIGTIGYYLILKLIKK